MTRRVELERIADGVWRVHGGFPEPAAAWPGHAAPVTGDVPAQLEAIA